MTHTIWFYSLLGVLIGSFLNVCIDRIPERTSLVKPASHCPRCHKYLRPGELIPIISFILLKGRCKGCNERIPIQVLAIEILGGVVFFLIWLRFGFSWETFLVSVYSMILMIIAFIDLEHQKILNVLIYPAIGVGFIMIPILHLAEIWNYMGGALLGFGVLFLIAILAPGAMGIGDVKLVLFLGLITGFPVIVIVLFFAFVSGGLIAGTLLALKKIKRKDPIAFGPYLALGGFIGIMYGNQIIEWWIRSVSG